MMQHIAQTHVALQSGADLQGFRHALRFLVAENIAPEQVSWAPNDLFGETRIADAPPISLPRAVARTISNRVHSLAALRRFSKFVSPDRMEPTRRRAPRWHSFSNSLRS